MKFCKIRWAAAALMVAALAACGGNDGGSGSPQPSTPVGQAISKAAADPANDTSTNSSSAFTVLQNAGVPAVTVKGMATVNFTVFSDGGVKTGLTNANVRFAIAKLVPGINGEIDQWQSYVVRSESTATAPNNVGSGPNGTPVLASAKQATTDPNTPAQLVYNSDGYYTYTFSTDIKDPAKTGGVTFEANRTHRIAIQLSYTNAAGETVLVNPYYDVTFDANGNSVAVTDPSKTRVMADVSSCNGCHDKLALHGGGRVDVQYCVMCHNPGTTDANSGNVLTMATMTHKIHAGRLLHSQLASGGEDYTIWGYGSSKHDYSEVGFPQDLRNCTVCHTAANPKTPQGDNWKTKASKEACLTCHASKTGSSWYASHTPFAASLVRPGAAPTELTNFQCAGCHAPGGNVAPERVHWNQIEANSAKYKMNVESVTYDSATRKVTVKYFLSDPTNNNAAYNLVTPDCTYTGTAGPCVPPSGTTNNTKFGNLRLYLAYQNLIGQPDGVTEWTAYNNGGNISVYAHNGSNDGSNRYTIQLTVPADTATALAKGTARIVSIGQIKEAKLEAKSAADPRPEVVPKTYVSTVVQHTYKDVALTGTIQPRREIVSNEKCNVCHGALGTTSGSNTLANAFHGGARNTVESCSICHDANRGSSSNIATSGLNMYESYQFKRMIHGIHGNAKRYHPFTHGNKVVGAFCNPKNTTAAAKAECNANLTLAADVENYAAEVAYPDLGINCNACHVNNSYQVDKGTVGAVVNKPTGVTDPLQWLVISPMAASCTACHDSSKAIGHVTAYGGSSFGNLTQQKGLQVRETCADCHSSGMFKGVDIVHGLK